MKKSIFDKRKPTMSKLKKEDKASMIYRGDLWANELETLYTLLRSTELEETTKWGLGR